jgi:hypothetical protein
MKGGRIYVHNIFQLVGLAPNPPNVCINSIIFEHLVKAHTKFKYEEGM